MVCFRFTLWWMVHKMGGGGGKGGHNSHEKQLLLMESKAGAEVLSGEGNDRSCVSSVPLARGVRVSGQPRGRPRRRRASALRPELQRPRMPVLCPSQSPAVSFCLWRWGCFLSSIHVVEVL